MRADRIERRVDAESERVKGVVVPPLDALFDLREPDSLDGADGVREVFVDDFLADSDRLEDLRGLVGLKGGYAHLRRDLDDAVKYRAVVVVYRGIDVLVELS